ncbi:hypothetical protein OYT88_04510 [Sporolactobacillus sp. CQH2019]|uniref:hypothetical protein n=1 Tax=Sporolactobacillus sp. CQH2019 TaxID=3023512 RepID=UPI0023674C62|nr:hypothetical protein [Sporolactobacillus sp. CQH2019]MDD9147811.1 hypothetical protein [Sporolactobacillus sp. CQH2019]
MPALDLTNHRFGRLVALYPTERRRHKSVIWHCQCDCGNIAEATVEELHKGDTRSCGCLRRETEQANLRKIYDDQRINNVNVSLITAKKRKDNKTGIKGVCYRQKINKYAAYIGVNGKQIQLGQFKNIDDAIKVRKVAEEKYYKPLLNRKKK